MTNINYRPVKTDDIDTAYDLYCYEHIESYGKCGVTKEDQLSEWNYPNFDLDKHTMYAFTDEGVNVGYAEIRVWRDIPVRPVIYAYVHPDYRGQGIGTHLTEWAIEAAQQFVPHVPDHARVVLQAFTNLDDGTELLENFGFVKIRESHLMTMKVNGDREQSQFPEGFRVITMKEHPVLEDFVRVYKETFRDHRGAIDEPLSATVTRWEAFMEKGDYPPENIVLVREGDRDAAVLFMADKSDEDPDQLWVETLGTMPDYRRKGLALNLLRYAYQMAQKKGKTGIGLTVDGSSLTGADKLYQSAGFKVGMIYHAYDYEIRPGEELTKQS